MMNMTKRSELLLFGNNTISLKLFTSNLKLQAASNAS